jgi:hypothetical protein
MVRRSKYEELLEQGAELVNFYRNHPVIAAYDLLNVDMAPIQRLVFRDMWFKNYVIAVCTRGYGKTFLLGTLAALSSLLYPGYRVGLIAPVFRQSKMIFSEVEKLYARSSLFREACEKRPIRGPDSCYVKLKAINGVSGSFIESLPLGDGSKVRGSRFYLVVIDELAQVPDQTLDMVVRPMAATTLEPMENVRRIERQEELIRRGLAKEEDFEEDSINKMIMTSSGYYKFNHMWRRMRDYWVQMDLYGEKSQYSVWQVPYWDLPRGFLDANNVAEAKRIMSSHEFSMEYEAAMISDSEGFFKASLLEECTRESDFSIELKGDTNAQYVLGVDPNQGGSASCGVVLIKLGQRNKVVAVFELKNKITQEMTMEIQDLCEKYNIIRVFMDRGGGGNAVKDLLEEGYGGKEPIIDITNDEHKRLPGRHILEMVNFNPAWITDANFATLALLEDKRLLFPNAPTVSTVNQEMLIYDSILTLKSQMMSIVVTQNASGTLHFDTPKKDQNKDLYSAMILAAYGARIIEKELEEPSEPQLYNRSGMIRERKPGASWNSSKTVSTIGQRALSAALLKPKSK